MSAGYTSTRSRSQLVWCNSRLSLVVSRPIDRTSVGLQTCVRTQQHYRTTCTPRNVAAAVVVPVVVVVTVVVVQLSADIRCKLISPWIDRRLKPTVRPVDIRHTNTHRQTERRGGGCRDAGGT